MSSDKRMKTAAGQSDPRRMTLKKILAGGGVITVGGALPERWKQPVLDTVALPAHASLTPKENGKQTLP